MRSKDPEIRAKIIAFTNQYYKLNKTSPSTAVIGEELGINKSTVYRYLTDMDEWGEIRYDGKTIETELTRKFSKGTMMAAHVGSIRCGAPQYEEEQIDAYYELPEDIFGKGEFYVLTAQGESMIEAGIEEGDQVVVRKTGEAKNGDIVVALLNGESTLKRLKKKGSMIFLHPENSNMEDIPVTGEDEFYVQGVASHVIKSLENR